jgi:ubiquitin-conjugating enzyme E2 W
MGARVQALSKIACSRLQKELAEWQVNPPAGFKHRVTDNLQRCPSPIAALPIPLLTSHQQSLRCGVS